MITMRKVITYIDSLEADKPNSIISFSILIFMGPTGGSFLRRAGDEILFQKFQMFWKTRSLFLLRPRKRISDPDFEESIVDYLLHIQIALIELNPDR